jgi:hypothetical protein
MFTAYRCSAPASDGDANIMSVIENDEAMPANKKVGGNGRHDPRSAGV